MSGGIENKLEQHEIEHLRRIEKQYCDVLDMLVARLEDGQDAYGVPRNLEGMVGLALRRIDAMKARLEAFEKFKGVESFAKTWARATAMPTCAYPGCGKDSIGLYGQAKIPKCPDHARIQLVPGAIMADAKLVAIDHDEDSAESSVAGATEATTFIAEPLLNSVAGTDSIIAAIAAVRVARKRRTATGKAISMAIEAHDSALERDKEAYDELQRAEQKLLDLIADGDT